MILADRQKMTNFYFIFYIMTYSSLCISINFIKGNRHALIRVQSH